MNSRVRWRDDAAFGVATVPAAAPARPLKRLYLWFALLFTLSGATLGVRWWLKPADGLNVEYFHTLNREGRPEFGLVVPEISMLRVEMDWRDRLGAPPEAFSARWFGYLAIGRAGDYTFATTSDDGSVLFVDGNLVVDNRGTHGAVTKTGRIRLESGSHAVLLEFDQEGGFREMQWSWARGDGPLAPVPPWRLSPERTPYWRALAARAADRLWPGAFAGALLAGMVLLYRGWPRHVAAVRRDPRSTLVMVTGAPSVPRRAGDVGAAAATALLSYAVSGLVTLILLQRLAQAPPGVRLPLIALACAAVLPLALTAAVAMRRPFSRPLEVAYGVLLIFMVAMIWLGAVSPRLYGDNVVRFLGPSYPFPRWLAGMATAVWLHDHVWRAPSVTALLPASLIGPEPFAQLLGATVMSLGTILVLRAWPGRLSVAIPILTPAWVLFASGHMEYYPLVATAWLAALAWLFEKPLPERSPIVFGCLIGILPALYLGFLGLSALAGLIYGLWRPKHLPVVLGAGAAAFVAVVLVCWPEGVASYVWHVYHQISLGEQHTFFTRYVGQAASPTSVFFKADYALSELHLRDVAYLVTWGGGWLMPAVFVIGAVVASRRLVDERLAWPLVRDARTWLGAALGVWQLYYLIFMIPKFGPTNDVDLFWPTTVAFAFFGGRFLDLVNRPRLKLAMLCAVAGCGVVTAVYLAWIGLPRRS